MSKEKLYSSPRWNEPIKAIITGYVEQNEQELIKSKKTLLNILLKNGEITEKEANERLEEITK